MSEQFYNQLPILNSFNDLTNLSNYTPLPQDWYIMITDVENSTRAIELGMYQQVNMAGVSVIAAMLDKEDSNTIPFMFGGDGSTLCIPATKYEKALQVLEHSVEVAKSQLDLNLRATIFRVKDINEAGKKTLISRFKVSEAYTQALFAGEGFTHVEELVKSNQVPLIKGVRHDNVIYDSLECRWENVKSPHDHSVSLIIKALKNNPIEQFKTYKRWLDFLYQTIDERDNHPINEEVLQFSGSLKQIIAETELKRSEAILFIKVFHILKHYIRSKIGKWLMDNKKKTSETDWGRYRADLIANSDIRKFDDALKNIISCSSTQLESIKQYLQCEFEKNQLVYGIHVSDAAVITCLIFKYQKDHIHFIDGSDGGYTLAARELKRRLNEVL